jgi:hypothetical protein
MMVILSSGMPDAAKARKSPRLMTSILINNNQDPRPTFPCFVSFK